MFVVSGFRIHRTDLLCTVTSSCVDVADAEEARHAQVYDEFSLSLSDAVLAQKSVLSVFTTRDTPLQQHGFFLQRQTSSGLSVNRKRKRPIYRQ